MIAKPGWHFRWPSFDYGVAAVAALPFLVLLFHRLWIVTGPSHLDPWYSLGYFLHLREYVKAYPNYYVGSRVVCWAPGALAYATFPPLAANYVLRLGYYLIATLSFYGVLKNTVGRRAALAGTVLMGTCWQFLNEIGWNYVDGTGIAYNLLTMWLLTRARDSGRRAGWLACAGAAFAAQVNTNLFLVTAGPFLALYYAGSCRPLPFRRAVKDCLAAAAGFAVVALLVGTALGLMTGNFFFFKTQAAMARYIVRPDAPVADLLGFDVPPLREWPARFPWLWLPAAAFLASVAYLVHRAVTRKGGDRYVVLFQVIFVLQSLLMVLLQPRARVLVIPWYVAYLIPTLFLAIGSQLGAVLRDCPRYTFLGLAAAPLGALAVLFAVGQHWPALHHWRWTGPGASWLTYRLPLGMCGLIPATLIFIRLAPHRRRACAAALVVLGTAFAATTYADRLRTPQSARDREDALAGICRATAVVDGSRGGLRSLKFWYDTDDAAPRDDPWPSWNIYESLNSVYLWGYTRVPARFPALPEAPPPDTVLVVLSRKDSAAEAALTALGAAGVPAELLTEEKITRRRLSFTVTVLKVLAPAPAPRP